MNLPGLLATSPDHAPGCKFCGTKSQVIAANGTTFWHPGVNCCAPSALLQLTWRYQDLRTIGEDHDASHHPDIRRDLARILKDAQEDGRDALEAFQAYIRTPDELNAAIAACRRLGYDYQYTHARSALHRRAAA